MKFKVGDRVKVLRRPTEEELEDSGVYWHQDMSIFVGGCHTITHVIIFFNNEYVQINNRFYFPVFILKNFSRRGKINRLLED